MNVKEFKKHYKIICSFSSNEEKLDYIDRVRDKIENLHFNAVNELRKKNLDKYTEIFHLLSKNLDKTKDDFIKMKDDENQKYRQLFRSNIGLKEKIKDNNFEINKIEVLELNISELISLI